MTIPWRKVVVAAYRAFGGVARYEQVYDYIERTRPRKLPPTWKAIVRKTVEDHSSDSDNFRGEDLFYSVRGKGKGVWGLREMRRDVIEIDAKTVDTEGIGQSPLTRERGLAEYQESEPAVRSTPVAADKEDVEPTRRIRTETYRILRDTSLARELKLLHENRCQICGESILLSRGRTYSEVHHIRPLSPPHNGPDVAGNIIILCPNHHVQCDYGAIPLDLGKLRRIKGHRISPEMIAYHNEEIHQG